MVETEQPLLEVTPEAVKARVEFFFAGLVPHTEIDRDYSVGHVVVSKIPKENMETWSSTFMVNGIKLATYEENIRNNAVHSREYTLNGEDDDGSELWIFVEYFENEPPSIVIEKTKIEEDFDESDEEKTVLNLRQIDLDSVEKIRVARKLGVRI